MWILDNRGGAVKTDCLQRFFWENTRGDSCTVIGQTKEENVFLADFNNREDAKAYIADLVQKLNGDNSQPMTKIQATEDDIPNEFILDENGDWVGNSSDLSKIEIFPYSVLGQDTPSEWLVNVVAFTDVAMTIKAFNNEADARAFAARLAKLLNEEGGYLIDKDRLVVNIQKERFADGSIMGYSFEIYDRKVERTI